MFQVKDVFAEAQSIFGMCSEAKAFAWMSDALTLIANKGDFEPWKGYLDICTSSNSEGSCVSLPREVGAVLGVNIGGKPTLGMGQLFNFHMNGPGDCTTSCAWSWQDKGGAHPVYQDIITPAKLIAYIGTPDDNGKKLVVHGFDDRGNPLKREEGGVQYDGYRVPTIFGYAVPDSGAPNIARVSWVEKEIFKAPVRLSTVDDSGQTGQLLAVYEPDETVPQYRRIKLSRRCNWVRIAYRYANPIFTSQFDRVPLASRIGFLLACRAVKFFNDTDLAGAMGFEANAARLEIEAQQAMESPTFSPIQVITGNNLNDGCEDIR